MKQYLEAILAGKNEIGKSEGNYTGVDREECPGSCWSKSENH